MNEASEIALIAQSEADPKKAVLVIATIIGGLILAFSRPVTGIRG